MIILYCFFVLSYAIAHHPYSKGFNRVEKNYKLRGVPGRRRRLVLCPKHKVEMRPIRSNRSLASSHVRTQVTGLDHPAAVISGERPQSAGRSSH
jgi:hypothetical protein